MGITVLGAMHIVVVVSSVAKVVCIGRCTMINRGICCN